MTDARPFREKEPALALVRQQIERLGPMTFERFVDLALYHPTYGYYSRTAPQRGRAGDYFTSMQVGGLLPEIFADALRAMREALGPEQFSLIEIGAGGGEFLESLLAALSPDDRKGLRVWAVERSRSARENIWRRLSRFARCEAVASLDEIDWMGGLEGCVFSNEFFDALPFHRLRRRGAGWNEIYVGLENGALVELELDLSRPDLARSCGLDNVAVPDGAEVEARPQIPSVYEEVGGRLARGYMLTIDYGYPRAALERPDKGNGTWRCFHQHQVSEKPFESVGRQDITADVDFTQLAEAGRGFDFETRLFCSQGIFLSHVGQDRIQKRLSSPEAPQVARSIQQLLHPGAMGERFSVLVQTKTADMPAIFSGIPDRRRRLGISDESLNLR